MRRKILKGILAGLGILLLWSSSSFALSSWKVCDSSGEAFLTHGNDTTAAVIGSDIASGDTLAVKDGAWVELVSTGDCEVWELKGDRRYTFAEHEVMGHEGDKVPPAHRLAVCFNPAAFSMGKAQRIGGIIERGGSVDDELVETGSNAALINLIIFHALSGQDIEKARPYYEMLKQRAPGSEFVKSVSGLFETKTPDKK
jgi:hypothetical protein